MIRVLRIMEFVYPDVETMDEHMGRWYIPANGTRRVGIGRIKKIASATIIDYKFEEGEESDES